MQRLMLTFVVVALTSPAAASGLDTEFGDGGLVVSPVEPDEQPRALVRFAGGLALAGKTWGPSTSSMQLVRFGEDGALVDVLGLAPGVASSGLRDAVVDAAGRLVVAGFAFTEVGGVLQTDAAFARFLPDGSVDADFGVDGVALFDVAGQDDEVFGLLALAAGGVLAVGRTSLPVDNGVVPTRGALWRVNEQGELARQAVVTLAGEQDELAAVTAQGEGYVAVGTAVYQAGNRASVAAVRVDDTLALDPAFANAGVGLYDPGAFLASVGVSVLVDGERLLLGATVDNGAELPDLDLAVLALLPDGRVDAGFGAGGVFSASVHTLHGLPDPTPDLLRAVVIDDAGAPVLIGDSEGRVVLVRAERDGALDRGFGEGGLVRVDVCGPTGIVADAVLVDGAAMVAGACYRDPFFADAVLLRFSLDHAAAEGEGEGEGEGDPAGGEGEGEPAVGEGEGEGEPPSCACGAGTSTDAAAGLVLVVILRCARSPRHPRRRPA